MCAKNTVDSVCGSAGIQDSMDDRGETGMHDSLNLASV